MEEVKAADINLYIAYIILADRSIMDHASFTNINGSSRIQHACST
jgi:hypothetical protein